MRDLSRTIGHSNGAMVSLVVVHAEVAAAVATRRYARHAREKDDMKQGSIALVATVAMLSASVTAAHGQARSGSQSGVVAAAFSAEVTGNVKSVDPRSGKLVLDTVDGPVNVTFPADAVQGINVGDQVTVSVALVKPPPSASPPSSRRTR